MVLEGFIAFKKDEINRNLSDIYNINCSDIIFLNSDGITFAVIKDKSIKLNPLEGQSTLRFIKTLF